MAFKMTSIIVTPQKDAEQVGYMEIQENYHRTTILETFCWHLLLGCYT